MGSRLWAGGLLQLHERWNDIIYLFPILRLYMFVWAENGEKQWIFSLQSVFPIFFGVSQSDESSSVSRMYVKLNGVFETASLFLPNFKFVTRCHWLISGRYYHLNSKTTTLLCKGAWNGERVSSCIWFRIISECNFSAKDRLFFDKWGKYVR